MFLYEQKSSSKMEEKEAKGQRTTCGYSLWSTTIRKVED